MLLGAKYKDSERLTNLMNLLYVQDNKTLQRKKTLVILIARAHCPAVGTYIIEVHHMG